MEKEILETGRTLSQDFVNFNEASPSPYHAVAEASRRLQSHGFSPLSETDSWIGQIAAGGKYFITRGGSTIVAFSVGKQATPASAYFKIVGAHTDSPCVRLAPLSKHTSEDFHLAFVQTYGGGLWHTWLDRDLLVAGRVLVKDGSGISHRLYRSKDAIAKIADVCIHLRKDRNTVTVNAESHLRAFWATRTYDEASDSKVDQGKVNHYRLFLEDVAKEVGCKVEEILDFDLCFADSQAPAIIGLNKEIISAPRLDNLFSSWAAVESITRVGVTDDSAVNMAALFDHEEIGSQTITGADSQLLPSYLERIFEALSGGVATENSLMASFQRSFFISADMAHAVHPAYPEYHQSGHKPHFNKGVVLKINANNRYTTNGISGAVVKHICEKKNIPLQPFIVRQDSPCGSTIGPLLSSRLGVTSIDVGIAQLGMHSIRETCGVLDAYYYTEFFDEFYKHPLAQVTFKL